MRVSLKSICAVFFFVSTVQASSQDYSEKFIVNLQTLKGVNPVFVQIFNKLHESGEPLSNGVRLCESISAIEGLGPDMAPRLEGLIKIAEKLQRDLDSSTEASLKPLEARRSYLMGRIAGEISNIIRSTYPGVTSLSDLPAFKKVIEDTFGPDPRDLTSQNQTGEPTAQ